MLQSLRQRREDGEKGFTLIELMVVVLIIAILIAIAIPAFLGARKRAQDRASQSNLRNALTAEKTYYTDEQKFTASPAELELVEPSLHYVTTFSGLQATGSRVYVNVSDATGSAVGTNDVIVLGSKSGSGKCFWMRETPTAGTEYGEQNSCTAQPTSWDTEF